MNLFTLFARSAAKDPDHVALYAPDESVTYRQLDERTARVAGVLRADGVRPGDRVAVLLPNVPAFASAYFGALRTGAVVVPMNPLLKSREVNYYLADSQVSVLFASADLREVVDAAVADLDTTVHYVAPGEFDVWLAEQPAVSDVVERDPTDTAVLLYTSGTTGRPKGAELTHANLTANAAIGTSLFGLNDQDVVIGALPLFHAFGQVCCLDSGLAAGASLVLVARFDPGAVLAAIERYRATIFMGVPTMYNALVHHPAISGTDLSTLRLCCSGGASLPLEVLTAAERGLGCVVLEGYGLSETSPVATFNRQGRRKPGSIGLPIDGVELAIVDETGARLPVGSVGEIAVRGHNVMKGYWGRPEETAAVLSADGWFRTGDLGRVDEEGFYFVVDRKKDLVIRGGYNVYPREVEEVLYEHPAVRECAVLGVPHAEHGEEVAAAVVLTEPGAATEPELREFVRERLAAYKYPRLIWFVDELPKSATNKILKRMIKPPVGALRESPPVTARPASDAGTD